MVFVELFKEQTITPFRKSSFRLEGSSFSLPESKRSSIYLARLKFHLSRHQLSWVEEVGEGLSAEKPKNQSRVGYKCEVCIKVYLKPLAS